MKIKTPLCSLALVIVTFGCGSKDHDDKADAAPQGQGSDVAGSHRQVLSCETKLADVRNQDGAVMTGAASCMAYEGAAFRSSAVELKQKCEVPQSDTHVSSVFYKRGCDINSYTNKCTVKGSAAGQAISIYYNSRVLAAKEMQAAQRILCQRQR